GGFVTSGSTGAALAAGLFHLKRMRGVHRPAVAVRIPIPGRPVLILDCGASVDRRAEWLGQFAYLGAAFLEAVHGVGRARGGLLIRSKVQRLRSELNQDSVGAGILLGLRGVAFVTHGDATPVGVATAVQLAHRAVEEGVVERTEAALRQSGSLAAASAPAVSVGSGS